MDQCSNSQANNNAYILRGYNEPKIKESIPEGGIY